jgi:hypothetical protein
MQMCELTHKTLRDEIAIAALVALLARTILNQANIMPYCQDAYAIADAMLKARESSYTSE